LTNAAARRAVVRLLAGALALAAAGVHGGAARKKRKKKPKPACPPCRPTPDAAAVAAFCYRGAQVGSSRASTLGQPFTAWRGGRLDRADVTARSGPGGQYAIEIRDLNQGQGISDAPVIGSATLTIAAIPQGDERLVTARFDSAAVLAAGNQYALVVRFLGQGDDGNYFKTANAATCFGPGDLQRKASGETAFTPSPGIKLEHTVYVLP
jgi:hypothetical protein